MSGMRCMPAVAQPTEAARTIAVFMLASDQRDLMKRREISMAEGVLMDGNSGCVGESETGALRRHGKELGGDGWGAAATRAKGPPILQQR